MKTASLALLLLCGAHTLISAPSPSAIRTDILITEFMASNDSTLRDEDGDSSDWIELHNASATTVSFDGWSLTDDADDLRKWRFPSGVELLPGDYLILFASGKDRADGSVLHTNFKLGADGEYLALVDRAGGVISSFSPSYPPQTQDVSFGRDAEDPRFWLFYSTPTPGERNSSGGTSIAPPVNFSRESGVFADGESFLLELTTPSPNATIHYTIGVNAPDSQALIYTAPIEITGSAIVRARAIEPGILPGPITSETYIAVSSEARNFGSDLPIMILHNFGQGPVPANKEDQQVAMLGFDPRLPWDARSGPRSSMAHPPNHAERGIFHVRGFLTAVDSDAGKASFLLELQDESGEDKDVALFGLPEESDWVLYAINELDRGLIQNPLAHQLRRDFGGYSSRTHFFEMFLKDDWDDGGTIAMEDYYGLFVLEERIKRDKNRVDIDALRPEHTAAPEITGGYILSIDDPNDEPPLVAGGVVMNWIDPDGFEMADPARAPQLEYIRGYFDDFYDALYGSDWKDPLLGYAAYIDVDSWTDYHIHSVVTFSADALRLSAYLYKPRNERIQFGPPWDFDISQGSAGIRDFNPLVWRSTLLGGGTDYFNEAPWWFRLFRDPNFWQRWIDRYQELRHEPLSTEHVYRLIDQFAGQVSEAQEREEARWNVAPRAGAFSAGGFFHYFGSEPLFENEVAFKKEWYALRLAFIDSQFLPRPALSHPGGQVKSGFQVIVTPPSKEGSITVISLDGADPRLPGGGISPNAITNIGPLTLTVTTNIHVVARSYNPTHQNVTGPNHPPLSSPWSGPVRAAFHTVLPSVRVTEIMYHPAPAPEGSDFEDESFEFIEVKNIGAVPLNLDGFRLGGGIKFDFPDTTLQPGELAVAVANAEAFHSRYPWTSTVLGTYDQQLDNAGERLTLEGPMGEPILNFTYSDEWHPVTDGLGFSLVHADPSAPPETWNLKEFWRPSVLPGAFPGADDPIPSQFPRVVINEALVSSSPNAIELHNLSPAPADISGWFLTDNFSNPKKHAIPIGTTIEANGFLVIHQDQLGFSLDSAGEELYLFSAGEDTLTGYAHGFDFGGIELGATFGRHVISDGSDQFAAQSTPTLGAANAGPRVGPVVISEIHFHPPDHLIGTNWFNNTEDEFVELFNADKEPVALSLFDSGVEVTWRLSDAVRFQFPGGQVLPSAGFAVVVGFDPSERDRLEAFRSRHAIPSNVAVYGPFTGNLSNGDDRVELHRPLPLAGASDDRIYELVERTHYFDQAPWPGGADGFGQSLQRLNPAAYGNDAINWAGAKPTPGRSYDGSALDDTDGDGMTDDQEQIAGTDPADPMSFLHLKVTPVDAGVRLEFLAGSNRTYTLQYSDRLSDASWRSLRNFSGRPADRVELFTDHAPVERYYRLVTPAQSD